MNQMSTKMNQQNNKIEWYSDQLKMEGMVEEVTEKPMSTTLYHHM